MEGKSTDHSGEKLYTCSVCGRGFSRLSGLSKHKCIHTGKKLWLGSNNHLNSLHTSALTLQRDRSSALCVGKDSSHLLRQQRDHHGERPFTCSEHSRGFITSSHLLTHQRALTRERAFSCSECGNGFTQSSIRLTHQRVHIGERPFTCSECRKGFTTPSHLVTHQRVHTGEKQFT
ncbi:zinc finger protein 436-like [Heterodontus francisci]|uniref:zinc finger protein 436-like n=1 Tax=Heterodontus francisci TaxID=7792 RepID=UPI00355BD57E